MNRTLSPLFISALVPAGSTNVTVNPTTLANPNRAPMLVDQFRLMPAPQSDGALITSFPSQLTQLQINLHMGNLPLTNGFVHVLSTMPRPLFAGLIWHLPKPLWVPPDVQISVQLRVVGATTTLSTIISYFSIVGRSVAGGVPIPKTIYAPWAASAIQDPNNTASTRWITPDNALGNPFNEPMRVTRLLGFVQNGAQTAKTDTHTVKMTLSNGKMLVRDPVPFSMLFPGGTVQAGLGDLGGTGYFDISGVLQPKQFIRGIVDYTATDSMMNVLGMVGYHEVPTPRGS